MATKNNQKYNRNKALPLIKGIDKLIEKSLAALTTGKIKLSISDFIRIVQLRRELSPERALSPEAQTPARMMWVDRE
jgi:hypothetical protein